VTDGVLRMQEGFISTSVLGGNSDGGNVLLDATLLLLDESAITAQAVNGNGGRIDIGASFMLRSASTFIDASSSLGVDGEVAVTGFDVDLNADIAPLPGDFLNAQRWLAQPCTSRLGTDVNRLTIAGRSGSYRMPSDFMPSPLSTDVPASREATAQFDWTVGTSALLAAAVTPCR
jgi:large exoprotein involved in heme utilization and adhesion